MRLARGYLLIAGAGTLLIGVLYVFTPDIFTDPMGFGALAPEALTDLRATYGGLQIAVGGYLLWTAADHRRHLAGLVLLSLLLPAVAFARAVGLMIDGQPTALLVGVLVFEVVLSVFSWAVLASVSRARESDEAPTRAV